MIIWVTARVAITGVLVWKFFFRKSNSCTINADCDQGFFCDQSKCTALREHEATCTEGTQCRSGVCNNGTCTSDTCTADQNCAPSQYCQSGKCVNRKSTDESCTTAYQCMSGICLSSGTCGDSTATSCADSADCAGHSCVGGDCVCHNDICVGCRDVNSCPVGASCTVSSDCVGKCENGVCTDPLPLGEACHHNNECLTGTCHPQEGVCTGCTDHNDCAGTAKPFCTGGGCAECTNDSECLGDTNTCSAIGVCVDQTLVATGNACTDNGECQTGTCEGGMCTGCVDDSTCGVDEYCNAELKLCTRKHQTGNRCTHDNECSSGLCADGRCTVEGVSIGKECSDGSDCSGSSNEDCIDGTCMDTCTTSGDCADTTKYVEGVCSDSGTCLDIAHTSYIRIERSADHDIDTGVVQNGDHNKAVMLLPSTTDMKTVPITSEMIHSSNNMGVVDNSLVVHQKGVYFLTATFALATNGNFIDLHMFHNGVEVLTQGHVGPNAFTDADLDGLAPLGQTVFTLLNVNRGDKIGWKLNNTPHGNTAPSNAAVGSYSISAFRINNKRESFGSFDYSPSTAVQNASEAVLHIGNPTVMSTGFIKSGDGQIQAIRDNGHYLILQSQIGNGESVVPSSVIESSSDETIVLNTTGIDSTIPGKLSHHLTNHLPVNMPTNETVSFSVYHDTVFSGEPSSLSFVSSCSTVALPISNSYGTVEFNSAVDNERIPVNLNGGEWQSFPVDSATHKIVGNDMTWDSATGTFTAQNRGVYIVALAGVASVNDTLVDSKIGVDSPDDGYIPLTLKTYPWYTTSSAGNLSSYNPESRFGVDLGMCTIASLEAGDRIIPQFATTSSSSSAGLDPSNRVTLGDGRITVARLY